MLFFENETGPSAEWKEIPPSENAERREIGYETESALEAFSSQAKRKNLKRKIERKPSRGREIRPVVEQDNANNPRYAARRQETITEERKTFVQEAVTGFYKKHPSHRFTHRAIVVDVARQRLYSVLVSGDARYPLLDGNSPIRSYPISTSRHGTGGSVDSFRTPTGYFDGIKAPYSLGQPKGAVFFEGRRVDQLEPGEIFDHELPSSVRNKVKQHTAVMTTRLIALHGLDPSNAPTAERGIFIHGTNREKRLLTSTEPASDGCIRMLNDDVVQLFDTIEETTPVIILPFEKAGGKTQPLPRHHSQKADKEQPPRKRAPPLMAKKPLPKRMVPKKD